MGRPTTKTDLMEAAKENYQKMNDLIANMTEKELTTPFDFSMDEKKKEAHWGRDKNLRDVLVHLYEWHQLTLSWVADNQNGTLRGYLPAPYKWNNIAAMNAGFWEKHQNTTLEDAKAMLQKSHDDILKLAETFTNDELFSKGTLSWTGGNALGSYFVSNTSSHYEWAMKKLKAHKKKCAG